MARFENCKIEQYVEHMTVERMEVAHMTVENQEVCESKDQTFDIDRFPASYFKFIRAVNDKERKAEVMEMREDIIAEAGKYDDISHRKQELLRHVFEPRIVCEKVVSIPSHTVTAALFGDVMKGISKQAHNEFRSEMLQKHRKLRAGSSSKLH